MGREKSKIEESGIEINGHKVKVLKQRTRKDVYSVGIQHVFIIGSKGIPAAYGGFETFVEKLTEYRVSDHIRYHVSRMADDILCYEYNSAECFDVKVPNIGAAKAVYYDVAALNACIRYCGACSGIKAPVFYILACRIGPFIGYFKKKVEKLGGRLYVNPDGHEWLRAKWNWIIRKYWKISEAGMVKHADLLVCDSVNIEKYILERYGKYHPKTTYIAYGSDTVPSILPDNDKKYQNWLESNGVQPKRYYLIVGRFVPENSFEVMLREFMKSRSCCDLVIITTANNAFYEELEEKLHFEKDKRIKFAGTVYDEELLKKIREGAYAYLHGHTVGGTNPSLLEALGSTELNLLVDVAFNREVALDGALYWGKEKGALAKLIERADRMGTNEIKSMGIRAKDRIAEAYSWRQIVEKYEQLFLKRR